MPTLFAVYKLKKGQRTEDYDGYLSKTKIPGIRGAPWCTDFKTWKVEKVLAPAVSEPEGELPKEPPYHYVAKIEVSDLNAMVSFMGTDAGKAFVKSWSVFIDPTAIFTLGHEMQQEQTFAKMSPRGILFLEAFFKVINQKDWEEWARGDVLALKSW